MSVLQAAWLIAKKDLLVETRSRELIYTTLFFAVSSVMVFAFAFVRQGQPEPTASAGILWVALTFSGTLALGRAFERERQAETLRGLLLAPVERASIYLGKLFALLILMTLVEIVLVPIVALFFHAPVGRAPWLLVGLLAAGTIGFAGVGTLLVALLFQAPLFGSPVLLVALLGFGTLGFAAVGTLFAAMLVRAQSRDVLLPVVLYPMTVPVIVSGVQGTGAIFAAEPNYALAQTCLALLVFFDAVFVTLALWTFAPVMHE
jgi:heme exporter protein CcmB